MQKKCRTVAEWMQNGCRTVAEWMHCRCRMDAEQVQNTHQVQNGCRMGVEQFRTDAYHIAGAEQSQNAGQCKEQLQNGWRMGVERRTDAKPRTDIDQMQNR